MSLLGKSWLIFIVAYAFAMMLLVPYALMLNQHIMLLAAPIGFGMILAVTRLYRAANARLLKESSDETFATPTLSPKPAVVMGLREQPNLFSQAHRSGAIRVTHGALTATLRAYIPRQASEPRCFRVDIPLRSREESLRLTAGPSLGVWNPTQTPALGVGAGATLYMDRPLLNMTALVQDALLLLTGDARIRALGAWWEEDDALELLSVMVADGALAIIVRATPGAQGWEFLEEALMLAEALGAMPHSHDLLGRFERLLRGVNLIEGRQAQERMSKHMHGALRDYQEGHTGNYGAQEAMRSLMLRCGTASLLRDVLTEQELEARADELSDLALFALFTADPRGACDARWRTRWLARAGDRALPHAVEVAPQHIERLFLVANTDIGTLNALASSVVKLPHEALSSPQWEQLAALFAHQLKAHDWSALLIALAHASNGPHAEAVLRLAFCELERDPRALDARGVYEALVKALGVPLSQLGSSSADRLIELIAAHTTPGRIPLLQAAIRGARGDDGAAARLSTALKEAQKRLMTDREYAVSGALSVSDTSVASSGALSVSDTSVASSGALSQVSKNVKE